LEQAWYPARLAGFSTLGVVSEVGEGRCVGTAGSEDIDAGGGSEVSEDAVEASGVAEGSGCRRSGGGRGFVYGNVLCYDGASGPAASARATGRPVRLSTKTTRGCRSFGSCPAAATELTTLKEHGWPPGKVRVNRDVVGVLDFQGVEAKDVPAIGAVGGAEAEGSAGVRHQRGKA